jgi:hypothetical protein
VAGLDNKIRTDGLTTPFPKAMPVILTTDNERDVWMRALRRRRYRRRAFDDPIPLPGGRKQSPCTMPPPSFSKLPKRVDHAATVDPLHRAGGESVRHTAEQCLSEIIPDGSHLS